MKNKFEVEIKNYINKIRIAKGYSVRCLAELSGVGKSQVNDVENGLKSPTIHTLCLMAVALGVEPERLYTYSVRYSGQIRENRDKKEKI